MPKQDASIDYLAGMALTSLPGWVRGLMGLRSRLGGVMGLKSGKLEFAASPPRDLCYAIGERAVFFTLIARTEDELVMGEDDVHLRFRLSVRRVRVGDGQVQLEINTAVWFKNGFGRLYFTVIKPFHQAIVCSILRAASERLRRPEGVPVRSRVAPIAVAVKGWMTILLALVHFIATLIERDKVAGAMSEELATQHLAYFFALGLFILFLGLVDLQAAAGLRQGKAWGWRLAIGSAGFTAITGLIGAVALRGGPPLQLLVTGLLCIGVLLQGELRSWE